MPEGRTSRARALLARISRVGVDAATARHETKYIVLTNQLTLYITLTFSIVALNPTLAQLGPKVRLIAVVAVTGYPLTLLFNHWRRHLAASLWLVVWSDAMCFAMCRFQLDTSETLLFFMAIGMVPWFLFPPSQVRWSVGAAVLAFVSFLAAGWMQRHFPPSVIPDAGELRRFAFLNRLSFFITVIAVGFYASRENARVERELEHERARSDELLHNVLPRRIAARLKADSGAIAERFDQATVLFADIVRFTELSERVPPAEVVSMLDHVFTRFDGLADAHGVEKIKTIGDAYMVAAGIPEPRADHVEVIAELALEMRRVLEGMTDPRLQHLSIRIGMHTGPVVAGVIGKRKFLYDLWGDTVNTASRMESQGEPGRIQVTEEIYRRLSERFELQPRGEMQVKGKGPMQTWFLEGHKRTS